MVVVCPLLYDAVGRLAYELVDGHAANAVGCDVSGERVLDVGDVSSYVGNDVAVFKHSVAVLVEGAVLQHQVVGIAQQLFSSEVAVDEVHVFRVPCQVLSVEYGVADGDVLALPEGVFCHDVGIVYLHVLAVLEHVLRVALQSVHLHVFAEHEWVCAVVQLQVVCLDVLASPECLVGIVDDHVLQSQVVHLAEHLRCVDACVAHVEMVAVPQCRACPGIELAVVYRKVMYVPKRIFAPKAAVHGLNVRALLDGALAIANRNILQSQLMAAVQWALALEMSVSYSLHYHLFF